MSSYLLDTSIFIAGEQGREIRGPMTGEGRVSVATLTELIVGVRRAKPSDRPLRETTLAKARSFIALPYDEAVAERLGGLLADARAQGVRAGAMDAIIAATALVHDLTVWTQDDDFEVLSDLAPKLQVVRD